MSLEDDNLNPHSFSSGNQVRAFNVKISSSQWNEITIMLSIQSSMIPKKANSLEVFNEFQDNAA